MSIVAINPKYQAIVNKAYKHLRQYHKLVNLPESGANDRKMEVQFEHHVNALEQLTGRERANFAKQHKKLHGYV